MQNRLYFISPINDRAFFIRRQQNNEQAKGWLDSDRGEKWEDRSSIIDWGLLKNKTDPDFSGKSRSDSCVSRLYVHQILRRRAKSTKRNLSSRWIDSVYSKQRVSSRYTRLRTVTTCRSIRSRNSLLTGSTVISFCA